MILKIDTTKGVQVEIRDEKKIICQFENSAKNNQSEQLLLSIKKALRSARIKLGEIKKIEVANRGGSFTSLRIGVATANALGYALQIPVVPLGNKKVRSLESKLVLPEYDREPNITAKKKI
jgi:tRNA threonylcarbamoyladenosine biosynthesis protein TsaB